MLQMEAYHGGNHVLYKDPRAQNITFLTVSPSIRASLEGGSIQLSNVVGMPYLTRIHWTQHTSMRHQQLIDVSQIPALKKRLSMTSFAVRVFPDRVALHRYLCLVALWRLALLLTQDGSLYLSANSEKTVYIFVASCCVGPWHAMEAFWLT